MNEVKLSVNNGMLQGYRALDLTDAESQLCGRILADLGVDVIRVEKPGGDSSRNIGPFYGNVIHPEKSLWWFALNANKRGITLDLEKEDGRELLKRLIKSADFVIESYPPGHMAKLGLDYSCLNEINPRIIVTSITPFGQTGPYQYFKASELTLMALGAFLFGTGEPDRPPVKPNYPLACIASSIHAASATLIAHYHRSRSGKGQYIDVSTQAGVPWFTGAKVSAWWQMHQQTVGRTGWANVRRPGDLSTRFIWPCRDGYVLFQLQGAAVGSRSNKAMAQWIAEEGMGDDYFRDFDWESFDVFRASRETVSRLEQAIATFFLGKIRQELAQEAEDRGVLLGYIDGIGRLPQNPQLASRQFWKKVEHHELQTPLTYPGFFFKSSLTSGDIRHRAPLIGEHNNEVYGEIGLSKAEILSYNQAGVI